jgi:hypothetical protein
VALLRHEARTVRHRRVRAVDQSALNDTTARRSLPLRAPGGDSAAVATSALDEKRHTEAKSPNDHLAASHQVGETGRAAPGRKGQVPLRPPDLPRTGHGPTSVACPARHATPSSAGSSSTKLTTERSQGTAVATPQQPTSSAASRPTRTSARTSPSPTNRSSSATAGTPAPASATATASPPSAQTSA